MSIPGIIGFCASSTGATLIVPLGIVYETKASDLEENLKFGEVLAITPDGNTIVIGTPSQGTYGIDNNAGAVYVFTRVGSSLTWVQQQKLKGSFSSDSSFFGVAVDISSDGNIIVVGARLATEDEGGAYIFIRGGSPLTWVEHQILQASDNLKLSSYGYEVIITPDGNTVIVGGYSKDNIYIYTKSGSPSTWTEQQQITKAPSGFGFSIAITPDENTLIVGAPYDNDGATDSGAVYIFTKSGSPSTWIEQQKLKESNLDMYSNFGERVAITSDGSTIIVSSKDNVYTFTKSGSPSTWTEQQQITKIGEGFGHSLAITSDGSTIIVGAPYDNDGATTSGAAYIFTKSGSPLVWVEQEKIKSLNIQDLGMFGYDVVISADGKVAVVGAPLEDFDFTYQGAIYILNK